MVSRSTDQNVLRHLDWVTVALYFLLIVAGVLSIYAACYNFDNSSIFSGEEFSGKQIRWFGLAVVIAAGILVLDSRIYEAYASPFYAGIILVLFITIFVAPDIKGSRSWLVFGSLRVQPAEFGKIATALALAKLFSGYNFRISTRANLFKALLIIFIPIGLILAQKETGSALAYMSLFFVLYREGMSGFVLFAAFIAVLFFVLAMKFADTLFMGIPLGEGLVFICIMILMVVMLVYYCKRYYEARNVAIWFASTGLLTWILHLVGVNINGTIYFLSVIVSACIYCIFLALRFKAKKLIMTTIAAICSIAFLYSVNFAFNNILQPHQQQRIKTALGIEEDLLGTGYNVNQAKIAIGSGGFIGKGFLNGTQTKLKYVPEQHTDFIFCTIGEEQGFVGATALVLIFLALILRVIKISERQPSTFGRVYGYCVASYLIFHLAINIGMVIGLVPVIGIPLPFISYGGSSLWGFTILLFVLLRIDASRRMHPSYL